MTVNHAQKRLAFTGVKTKVDQAETTAAIIAESHTRYAKRECIREWQKALEWHRHMIRLSLRAHDYRQKQEKLLMMLVVQNARKVLK